MTTKEQVAKHAIILFGAPGCGKGTVSEVARGLGYYVMPMGDIVRDHIKNDPQIANIVNSGKYVPDRLILELLEKHTPKEERRILFDGVPRTRNQANNLMNLLWDDCGFGANITTIHMTVDRDVAIKRQVNRKDSREDKSPEIIRERMSVYENESRAIAIHLMKYTRWHEINANESKEIVATSFRSVALDEARRISNKSSAQESGWPVSVTA